MSAPAAPTIPPRPSKSTSKEGTAMAPPQIPARPTKNKIDRAVSPNPHRFAPSPLGGGLYSKGANANRSGSFHSHRSSIDEPIERSGSTMPSVGEEGMEYSAYDAEKGEDLAEQTRTVGDELKLHAPKPSLPAQSAKQRVMTVTRTDSDKAASFGIGRPSTGDDTPSSKNTVKRKPSSIISTGSDHGHHTDDEHGIPEFGQRVPMNPYLGDVQAPSPDPDSELVKRHHQRKHSARSLPPGSYGLHGHGVLPQDKLERAYYEKHPELRTKEHHPLHDRQNDFAMSSNDLNRLVRDTANRSSSGISREITSTPTEDVAFQASEEYTHRMSRPSSSAQSAGFASKVESANRLPVDEDGIPIHVDDAKHPEFYSYGGEGEAANNSEANYKTPILAADEIEFGPNARALHPAVHPHHDRSESFDSNASQTRPLVRPSAVHRPYSQPEYSSTPLEDVTEYEPLFPEEAKKEQSPHETADENKARHHFPSKDIWEDAPNSVHYTVEVATPEPEEDHHLRRKSSTYQEGRSITPAQAFAQYQEELAEKETKGRVYKFLPLLDEKNSKPTWIGHQAHLAFPKSASPQRFPSRDVWEDAPESQHQEAYVSDNQEEEETNDPGASAQAAESAVDAESRPAIPERPKPRQESDDHGSRQAPLVSDKPKPQIPARPLKKSFGESSVAKPKPPVPTRPVGGKIAALQAGFMSDLNKRLQLGPQAPKKEEEPMQEPPVQEEKTPLADARKSRARGPQRRAPAQAAAPTAQTSKVSAPTLSFSPLRTCWSVNPDFGEIDVTEDSEETVVEAPRETDKEPSSATLEEAEPIHKVVEEAPIEEKRSPGQDPPDLVGTEHSPYEESHDRDQPEEVVVPAKPVEIPPRELLDRTVPHDDSAEANIKGSVGKEAEGVKTDSVEAANVEKETLQEAVTVNEEKVREADP